MNKFWKPALLLAAVAVMVIGMLGSGAWFTDTATSATNSLTSGTLSIEDAKLSEDTLGTIAPMAPGDKTGEVVIVVKNNGNLPLFWVGNLVIEGPAKLKEAIYIDYAMMQFEGGSWAEADDNFITNGVGSGLYPTDYNAAAALNKFHKIGLNVFDGRNFMGVTPNEFMGALKPGYNYRLTLKFGFAEGADNSYQGLGPLTIKFVANAMQPKAEAIHAYNGGWDSNYMQSWALGQIANQLP
jgi:predicted ribosomally synthesized peptide with SipW-like signal peptide